MKNYWIFGVVAIVLLGGVAVFLQQKSIPSSSNQPVAPESSINSESPMLPPQSTPPMATNSGGQSEAKIIEVTASNFKFSPSEIRVKQGDRVVINFKSGGGIHDFVIDEYNVATKQTSSSDTVEFTASKAGTFEYYCSVGNHKAMGMRGNLIVE